MASSNPTGTDIPRVCLSYLPSQQHNRGYMQDLCVNLNLHGVSACQLPVAEPDRRRWFKNRVKLIQQATVYVPLIDTTWVHMDEGAFELYYALRHYVLHGSPMILPVFEKTLLDASEDETTKIRASLNDAQLNLLISLEDSCASLNTEDDPKRAAVQIINLLVELGCTLPESSVATGGKLSQLYVQEYAKFSKHRANSGIVKLLKGVESAKNIRELDLGRCFIADAGGQALACCLAMMPVLTRLDLSENGLGNASVMLLCRHLRTHPSLASLNLWGNEIAQAGVAELYFLIGENPRIVDLNIGRNPIYSKVWETRIQDQLKKNFDRQESQRQLAARVANAYGTTVSESAPTAWMGNPGVRWRITFMNTENDLTKSGRGEGLLAAPLGLRKKNLAGGGDETPASRAESPASAAGGPGASPSPIYHPLIMAVRLESSMGECKASLTITEGQDVSSLVGAKFVAGADVTVDLQSSPAPSETHLRAAALEGTNIPAHSTDGGLNETTKKALLTVMSSVHEFLDKDLSMHSLTVQRLNGKHLKFLLEPTDARTEKIARETLDLCAPLPQFRTALLSEQERLMAGSLPNSPESKTLVPSSSQHRTAGSRSPTPADLTALVNKIYLRVENNSAVPEKSLFIERDLTLWRGMATTKSLAQIYRFQIGQYSGNIRDEVSALLDLVNQEVKDAVEGGGGSSTAPNSARSIHSDDVRERLGAVMKAEEQEDKRYDDKVSKGVVDQWGKAGRSPRGTL